MNQFIRELTAYSSCWKQKMLVVKKDVLSESLETEARLSHDDRNVVSIVDKSTNNFC